MSYQVVLPRNVDEEIVAVLVRRRPDEQLVVTEKVDRAEDELGSCREHQWTVIVVKLQLNQSAADVVFRIPRPLQHYAFYTIVNTLNYK